MSSHNIKVEWLEDCFDSYEDDIFYRKARDPYNLSESFVKDKFIEDIYGVIYTGRLS